MMKKTKTLRATLRHSDWAWIALVLGILGYEIAAKDNELLSEAFDRYMERTPWLMRIITGLVALHLINAIPPRYDLLHLVFSLKKKRSTVILSLDSQQSVS